MHFPFLTTCHGKPEEPIFVFRQHPILFLKGLLLFIVLALLPAIFPFIAPQLIQTINDAPPLATVSLLILALYELTVLLLTFTHFFNWFFDIWVVTRERIIDVDQEGVFSKKIGELEMFRVQDVVAEQKGVLATLFHFGKIKVETAGAKEEFAFEGISQPYVMAKRILEMAEADRELHLGSVKEEMANS